MREAVCGHCGATFPVKPYSKGLFCSRSCRAKAMVSKPETHPRWKGGDLTLECANCGATFTRRRLGKQTERERQYCSPTCKKAHMVGPNSPTWKGGRIRDVDGYIRVYRPDHAHAFASGYAHEHVVVAAEPLGGRLPPGAVVHHANGDRADNRPENLVVLDDHSEHMKLHHREGRRESGHPGD